jgi:hypothetical protein
VVRVSGFKSFYNAIANDRLWERGLSHFAASRAAQGAHNVVRQACKYRCAWGLSPDETFLALDFRLWALGPTHVARGDRRRVRPPTVAGRNDRSSVGASQAERQEPRAQSRLTHQG